MCSKIQRTRVKGTWVRTSSSPESEPDFFSMDPVGDMGVSAVTSSQSSTKPKQHSGVGNQSTACSPNFVSPKSSPALLGERDVGAQLQQSIILERFNLDVLESDQACHDVQINKNLGSLPTNFGIHPPPSLPELVLSKDGTSFGVDQMMMPQGRFSTFSHQQMQSITGQMALPKDSNLSSWTPQWYATDIPSLTRLGKALSTSDGLPEEDEDELQMFLRDVDLGFELEMVEEILQTSAF